MRVAVIDIGSPKKDNLGWAIVGRKSDYVDECFSILGAMMLRTGWTADVSILSKSCLVVRPD